MGGVRAKGEVNITEMATVLHDAKVNKNRGGGGAGGGVFWNLPIEPWNCV